MGLDMKVTKLTGETITHRGVSIRERFNPSGSVSYRVELPTRISGVRRFVQLKTKAAAKNHIDLTLSEHANLGTAAFSLSSGQREEAAKAFALLQPTGRSLSDAVDFFLRHFKPPQGDITSATLAERFLENKRTLPSLKAKEILRERSLRDLRNRLALFNLKFGEQQVKSIAKDDVIGWISHQANAPQTRKNFYRVLFNFFSYGESSGYLGSNPLAKLSNENKQLFIVPDHAPEILTIEQSTALLTAALNHLKLDMLGYVTLALFTGIRREELARLTWDHVRITESVVAIPREIAKKRRNRDIAIPENAVQWLLKCPRRIGPIVESNLQRRLDTLRETAGLQEWPHNALRHSAASYHFAMHNNGPATCAMLGQKQDDVLFGHYRKLVKKETAERFYKLMPPVEANIIPLAAANA